MAHSATNAYHNFLDFFSMHNKERLDGLSESYFTAMTYEERGLAFDYLLKLVDAGGTEESVNGLFRADPDRAVNHARRLLEEDALCGEAQIAAAWNLSRQSITSRRLSLTSSSLVFKGWFVPKLNNWAEYMRWISFSNAAGLVKSLWARVSI